MNRQFGGVENVFKGPMYQQGYGLGGYFKKFFKWLIPIAEKHVMPSIKSGFETIGKQAIDSASRIASDAVNGRNIQEAAREHVSQAIDNLKSKAENKLAGNGKKRKKFNLQKIISKKQQKDIFH